MRDIPNQTLWCPPVLSVSFGLEASSLPGITLLWLSVNCPACRVVIISGDAAEGAEQALIGLTFALLQKPVPSEVPIAAVCSNAIRNASGMSGARRTRRAK